jgi:3'-phosphoadenosine 5'-phosphosulfate sulfotransferase (PAPS reductase)/FAD synthetase
MNKPIQVISLGAGVQSSTMALMAASGELPIQPEFAVFADTGDEPDEVYDWLATLKRLLPFKVVTAARSKLSDNLFQWGFSQIPCFVKNNEGKPSKGKRQCTKHWKIMPMYRSMRQETGAVRKRLATGHFESLIGISVDEASRMKDARVDWVKNKWPLIDAGLSRTGCKQWLDKKGLFAPKSACFYCPLKDNASWARISEDPKYWPKILEIDRRLNERGEYLHSSCIPMSERPFLRAKQDREQPDLFQNECEGMCGV